MVVGGTWDLGVCLCDPINVHFRMLLEALGLFVEFSQVSLVARHVVSQFALLFEDPDESDVTIISVTTKMATRPKA